MATLKITVEPGKSEKSVFTADQLALAIQGKKIETPLVDDKNDLVDALWDEVCKNVRNSVAVKGDDPVDKLGSRLKAAKIRSRSAGGTIEAGKHRLEVTVVGVKVAAAGSSSSSKSSSKAGGKAPTNKTAGNSSSNDEDDEESAGTETDKCSFQVVIGESEDSEAGNSNDDEN